LRKFVLIAVISTALLGIPAYAHAQAPDPGSFPNCPLLLEGQSADCVRALQTYLNIDNYGYRLTADGIFGPATRIAVLDFQGRNHLPADGNVGPVTAGALLTRVDEVRRDIEVNSVPTPRPGAPLPLGDLGAAVGQGKSVSGCVKELLPDEIVEKGILHWAERQGAKEAVRYLSKFLGPASVAEAVWCISFAQPE